ncbi:MAG: AAA family ATPase [Proteobacteria bacterium]|uniref:AAA family ATPase n=1 Tax=Gulbenkiania mobilis TaxID=397457 RepID=UPI0006BBE5AC|nr:AAA family ATPase [Gulbenkiania mobilis]MBS0576258.1 AAA family ATPase [Pseudomonadota bacterium]
MKAKRFRIQNFRNIDDSGWILLDQVTAFVGRNESGKTALLKALHKFNPASPEPYDPMREFPRDRYMRDFVGGGSKGSDWPVCSVAFAVDDALKADMADLLPPDQIPPTEVIATRYYDGSITFEYEPDIAEQPLSPEPILAGLKAFASGARRLRAPTPEQEEATAETRNALAQWATQWQDKLKGSADLRGDAGAKTLAKLKAEAETKSSPQTADLIEALHEAVDPILEAAKEGPVLPKLDSLIEDALPVLIYFENYGVLDSAIYLPRFLEDLQRDRNNPRVRTINAMFKHVALDAKDIADLGAEEARAQRQNGQQPNAETVAKDQRRKEERAIRLNSASNDISTRFSDWWSQRRHKIRYHADGDYFRIWVADDRRPDVEIELEARSKGFQWFFSFYLVFLVESEEGHKDAILLLDEPGMNLHPTAQQELLVFFERLAEKNQLVYTTHSPFLVDGEHIYRVRPVTEDNTGHSRISADTWPRDRETIFPLQAAAGYAMLRGLFQHKKNVLVEGMSDYYYLHALNQQCRAKGLPVLSEDIYITPCGGTKLVGHIAALFLGQDVRPLILLDSDEAGRVRRDALLKELYLGKDSNIVMLDEALQQPGATVEIEDILGEDVILPVLNPLLSEPLRLPEDDGRSRSLPDRIKASAKEKGIDLPDGWKTTVALQLVSSWSQRGVVLPDPVLERAGKLFFTIQERFAASAPVQLPAWLR